MKTSYSISIVLLTLLITTAYSQCITDCTQCFTSTACNAATKLGNNCVWKGETCGASNITTTAPPDTSTPPTTSMFSSTSYQSPSTTSYNSEECICRRQYYSEAINEEPSCECYFGMKSIKIQYTGTTTLTSLIFYQNSNGAYYEDCIFTNIQPNDIVECISFPYLQFVSTVIIKTTGQIATDNCESTIDTLCTSDILNTSPDGCTNLEIVGWIDTANYMCSTSTSAGNRRRRLNGKGISGKGISGKGINIVHRLGGTRRLQSSSSSSSSSDGDGIDYIWRPDTETDNTEITPTPTIHSPVVPYISTTDRPTPADTDDSDTTSTSTTSVGSISSTSTRPWTTASIQSYCDCASAESWDDYHYYDTAGNVVTLARESFNYVAANSVLTQDDDMKTNDKVESSSNMMTKSDAKRYYGYYYCFILLISMYFIM